MCSRQTATLLLALCCAGGSLSFSQEARATLGGRVTDPQGAVVPQATVSVVSVETGVSQETRANAQGNWTVQFLLPGHYYFTVAAPGFKTEKRQGISLQTADNKQIDVQLEVGSAAQSVEVTSEAPLIDTTSATSGTVITREEITEIPSQSHVITLLATLSPGVIQQDQNGNVVHMWSVLGASQITADGGRNNIYSNNFQLDGMPNTQHGGNVSFIPPMDSVQEFRVQTNAYDASIGRQAGSTVNMQTKSGSKDYHGTLYEFNQNNFLNANLFQTNLVGGTKPPVHFNEFGGTVGGPVWIPKLYNGREKTFFFVSYDKTLNQDPRPGGTRSVPTAVERTGDFSQSFTTQTINGQLQRFPIQIFDPNLVDANGNRQPFLGNKIPADRLSPIAQKIVAFVPLPNTAGDPTGNAINNFVSSATRQDKFPVVSVRVDQNWNNSHHSFATVRWSHLNEFIDDYFHNSATGNFQERIAENAGVDHVWTLSPSKILDLRFSVSRFSQPNFDKGSGFDPAQLGFPASFVSQLPKPSFPYITGFAGATTDNPQHFGTNQAGNYYANTYYTWSANLTHVHGNHTFRYGAEYWILQDADGSIGDGGGRFDFNNVWTRQSAIVGGGTGVGSTFASFLLGLPSGGSVPVNANAFYSQHYTGFYFQDDWRVTSRLTLNLGMRWDYERPVEERYNRMTSNFDPTAINPISSAAQTAYTQIVASNAGNAAVKLLASIVPPNAFQVPGAQLFAGVAGQSRAFSNTDLHEWQPRAGFAYRLGRDTVIRGGFGRFTQADFENATASGQPGQNGFSRSTTLIASQDNNFTPYDTLANPFRGGILATTGSALGPLTNLGQGISWDNQNPGRAYSWEYSLHVQHQIKSWLFEIGYSHNKTYNIYQDRNRNLPSFSLWQQLRAPQFDSTGRPLDQLQWDMLVPNPFFKLPGVTGSIASSQSVALNQLLNPIPLLGTITERDNPLGKNRYDALLAKVEHRFHNGFSIINAFTWSKLFEDTSLIGPEIAGAIVEHKLGGEDRPFHFSVAPIWELPFGRGKRFGGSMPAIANAIVGGWELAGQYNVQSGVPVAFTATDNFFFSGKDPALPKDQQSLGKWFDTSQFIPFPSKNTDISNYPAWTGIQNLPGYSYRPAANDTIKNGVYQDFGASVRTVPTRWGDVRASRVNEANIGLYKNVPVVERMKLQLRFDVFNAFNHPRFPAPDTNPGNATFGRVPLQQQNQARAVELGARLTF
ncbi:MAG: carboxypeptidase regulatory-like domain-containing protein [Bryobacteraceae bacterium]